MKHGGFAEGPVPEATLHFLTASGFRGQPPPPDPDLELSAETATKLIGGVSEDLGRLKW
jgi:hypothetical protein